MSYSPEVYRAAEDELSRRRTEAEQRASALRARMTAQNPRIAELELMMRASAAEVARAVVNGGNVEEVVAEMRRRNEAAQKELAEILHAAGETVDNFAPQYACKRCSDTGYVGREMCDCFRLLLADGAARRLSRLSGMQLTSLDGMDLSFYKDRAAMQRLLDFCRSYGENFSAGADSLLLFGPTGTGKTHVSLAIAAMAAQKGYSVVYGPTQQLIGQMEREHFGREEGDTGELLNSADLLVLDDLGTELTGSFYQVSLLNLVNTRLLTGRPTIISTNLTPPELQSRYGVQLSSRILGTYLPLQFKGDDIRQQKLERRLRNQ